MLARAGTFVEWTGNLGRRFYLVILIPLGLAAMALAAYAYLQLFQPLISELLGRLRSTLDAPAWGVSSSEEIRNYTYALAALAGSLAFLATVPFQLARVWINERNARNAEENLATDLINKAVEGLGAEKTVKKRGSEETLPNIEVRIGAIYQLERIAHTQAHSGTDQGARDHIRIMEILCAYIRENAPAAKAVDLNMDEWPDWPENPSDDMLVEWDQFRSARREELANRIAQLHQSRPPRTDIQTALTVLGRRGAVQIAIERKAVRPGQEEGYTLNLRGTCLQAVDLSHLDLGFVNLWRSRLEGSDLSGANLEFADLRGAKLESADLSKANLKRAFLREARLEGANLREARLAEANLRLTRLETASLWSARLERADLSFARLQGAMLGAARLDGADLERARLHIASLNGAHLEGANLRKAKMAGADLAAAQLQGINLSHARLEAANLGDADMERANFAGVRLSALTTFSPATLRGARLRDVDLLVLAPVPDGLPDRLVEAFGDASVKLPPSLGLQAGVGPLAHWPRENSGSVASNVAWHDYLRTIGDLSARLICADAFAERPGTLPPVFARRGRGRLIPLGRARRQGAPRGRARTEAGPTPCIRCDCTFPDGP